MPRTCTVCAHPERKRIDGLVVEGGSHASQFMSSVENVSVGPIVFCDVGGGH
jgi:hypothetical protein